MKPAGRRYGQVTAASAQGERSHQEDRPVHQWIEPAALPAGGGWILAAFDGHRGAMTAEKAAKALVPLLISMLQAQKGNVPAALRASFAALHQMTQGDRSGSTASIAFVPQDAQDVTLAVLGDSPIAVLDSRGAFHVGPEHNVRTNIKERAAAEARGGIYQGGYLEDMDQPGTGLQMARSLGDADLSRVLGREPDIETVALGGRGVVLVGTDGLLAPGDGPSREQLPRLLKMIQQGSDAEAIVQDALKRQTGDNVTAIVWKR